MHDRAAELAIALRQLAASEDDVALSDALLEAVAKIERFADYKLRNQAQTVIGDSYMTLSERVDALLNVSRDTHQLVMGVQADQHTAGAVLSEQGAAVRELRAEFQSWAESLGDRLRDMDNWRSRVEVRLHGVDAEMASFRGSRDRSIAERERLAHAQDDLAHAQDELRRAQDEINQLLADSVRDRSELRAWQSEAVAWQTTADAALARIEAGLSGRAELAEQYLGYAARIAALEALIRGREGVPEADDVH